MLQIHLHLKHRNMVSERCGPIGANQRLARLLHNFDLLLTWLAAGGQMDRQCQRSSWGSIGAALGLASAPRNADFSLTRKAFSLAEKISFSRRSIARPGTRRTAPGLWRMIERANSASRPSGRAHQAHSQGDQMPASPLSGSHGGSRHEARR